MVNRSREATVVAAATVPADPWCKQPDWSWRVGVDLLNSDILLPE